ncbi:MAG: tetratricopeptide repeat protein [Deltaproteobacteria bacterium]|nr:MAG: tetratricopeptide repeat protein [Deltaproteobacteria bacterium]
MIRRSLALLLLAALTGAAPALAAETRGDLQRALDRFDYGNYEDAARLVEKLLAEGRLVEEGDLIEAYRILGLSYYYLKRREKARSAFVRLLSLEPDYRLDPFFHPPKIVEFFDQVRAENESLLAPIRERKKRIEAERRLQEEARRRLLEEEARRAKAAEVEAEQAARRTVVERTVRRREYLLNWLPFGAGQFQNDEPVKGAVLAAAQAATGLASVVGFAVAGGLRECERRPVPKGSPGEPQQFTVVCGVAPQNLNLAQTMDRVKWIAGGMFWGLVVYGIVDAHLHYRPTAVLGEVRREEGLGPAPEPGPSAASPPAARLSIQPQVTGDGAGALLSLEF